MNIEAMAMGGAELGVVDGGRGGRGKKPHFSPSALYPFFGKYGCQVEFDLKWNRRLWGPTRLRMALGTAIDKAFEVNLRQKVKSETDLPTGDVIDAFVDYLGAETTKGDFELEEGETPHDIVRAKREGIVLIRKYMDEAMPWLMPQSASDVQWSFRIEVPWEDYDIVGKADYCGHVLDAGRDNLAGRVLLDWKVKAKPLDPSELANDLQLTIYLIAFRQHFQAPPSWIGFHQLIRAGSVKGWRWLPIPRTPEKLAEVRAKIEEDLETERDKIRAKIDSLKTDKAKEKWRAKLEEVKGPDKLPELEPFHGEVRWPARSFLASGKLGQSQPSAPYVDPAEIERTAGDLRWFWHLFATACKARKLGVFVPISPTSWKCSKRCDVWEHCRGAIYHANEAEATGA